MAVREIKTTLSLDGEKEFNRAISEAGRGMRVMASEMKAAAADFDVTGDEMEYLGRKSRSLNGQIEQQEKIIRALEGAVADSAQTYGEASAKTDGYRIKLNNAYASLSRLKKEHEQTDKRMEELGRDSERTGRRLEQGIGEAADDVSRKFDGMVNKLDSDLGSIKAMTSISAVVDVAGTIGGAVKGAYDGVKSLVDETADYNRSMGFLKTNAEQAGISFDIIKQMAIDVTGLTGDMDASIEGLSNLLKSGLDAEQLATAVERLSGAIIQIPDTLKFESLADGLQETIATGEAVGQYAEYLERMGIKLEDANKAMKNASKYGQDAVESVALALLSGHGAEETLAQYLADSGDIVEYYKASAELADASAELGRALMPIVTVGMEKMSEFLGLTADVVNALNEVAKNSETIMGESKEDWWEPYQQRTHTTGEDIGILEGFKKGFKETKDQISDFFDGFFDDDDVDAVKQDGNQIGEDIAQNVGDGIYSKAEYASNATRAMMDGIQAELNRKFTYPTIRLPSTTGSTAYASAGTSKTTIALDGKKLGEATVAYNSAAMGESLIRAETYG